MKHLSPTTFQQAELFPASDFSQRWDNHRPTWRYPDQGGFDRTRYTVSEIPDDTTARQFVEAHHYSKSCPAMRLRYGMYEREHLVGIAILSVPARKEVLTNAFRGLLPYTESLELGRFFLKDQVPSNGETYLLARVFELARKSGVRGIVSFSDPVPRTTPTGETIFLGHIGEIYKIKGAVYTGRSDPRTIQLLPNGTILHERTLQKIRAQETGHDAAEKRLRDLGAPPMRSWETPAEWLSRALPMIGIRRLRHSGNHRYVFPLDRRVQVSLPILPYPSR